jgi:hypothetical protein
MEINRYEIGDMLAALPDRTSLNIDKQVDLFICTLGFEDRSHGIIDKLKDNINIKSNPILVIKYPTNKEDNSKNLKFFEEDAARSKSRLIPLFYTKEDFVQNLISVFSDLKLNKDSQIVFDISTCSSYLFYPIMKTLFELDINLTIAYTEADKYYPTFEEWDTVNKNAESENTLFVESFENANFQSSGVDNIYNYNVFSEINPGNKPCTLVAVPNFSCKRMNSIIARDGELNKTKYEDIVWIIGKPPAENNEWRVDAIMKTNNVSKESSRIKYVSTLEYKDMLKVLEDVWSDPNIKYKYHLTIGNLGSKNQHLGTFFFLALHKEIGLWLTEPMEFQASRFSEGIDHCWQINFGSLQKLRTTLEQYLTLRWQLC